jgi:hypothetical protein
MRSRNIKKLHSDIKRLLRAQRRHAGILRLAVVAVTGKARRKTLLYRLGERGKHRKASNEECHGRLEHGKLSESRLNRAEGGAPPSTVTILAVRDQRPAIFLLGP